MTTVCADMPVKIAAVPESLECSFVLVDLSGFTQLIYLAQGHEKIMPLVLKTLQRFYNESEQAAQRSNDITIISTTGDGFIAIAGGELPSRRAVMFGREVGQLFDKYVKPVLHSLPFRQHIALRIAFHHGRTYRVEIGGQCLADRFLYVGDDLNLLSRVVNSQVARKTGFAVTRSFYQRLMLTSKKTAVPDEVILDRNQYPEPIEIFMLPEEIPDYEPMTKKTARI